MSEEPKSFWRKPWRGPRALLLWFIILACAMFVTVFALGLLPETGSILDVLTVALICSIGVPVAGFLAVQFIRWLFCWQNLKRFLFGIACFITLIALVVTEENWRGKWAWEKYKRECEAKGERFDLASLVPASVPDDQNFAMTPLLKTIYEYTYRTNGVRWTDTNLMNRLDNTSAELRSHGSTNDLVLGNLEKGTLADLEACRNFYRGNTNYPQPVRAGTAAEDVLVALSKFDPEMKELREAAASRPYSRFPIHYDYEPPNDILFPHLSHVKRLASLFRMSAVARLEASQSQDALEDLKLGLRLSDSMREEPILIDHLVRIAVLGINLQGLREGLVRHAWSDAQLAELEKYLASLDLLDEFKRTMRGERAFSIGCLDYMRRQGFKFSKGGNSMPSGWHYQNMLTISRMHQDFMLAAVDERAHRAFPDISEKEEIALEKMRAGPYTIFAKLLMPALSKAIRKSARMQTYVDATRIGCALERYRLANGKLPDVLDALTPRFIDKIPNDVIDGKPLRYQRTPDGYVIYSVGWNKTDDGGELVLTKGKTPSVDATKGDWVWRYPAKE